LSELQSFSERVATVTLEQVNAVARKYARPGHAWSNLNAAGVRSETGYIEL
jgi:hypothetical protein